MDGQPRVPVLMSAAAGVRFLRERWREAGVASLAGAGAMAGLTVLALIAPALAAPAIALQWFAPAFVFAALSGLALNGSIAAPGRLLGDAGRIWAAMALVGLFLAVMTFVAALPSLALISAAAAPFAAELEAFRGRAPDPAAARDLVSRMFAANPWPFVIAGAANVALWFMLTSRLYLAAPATVASGRIATFETWALTKNNMLRIAAARLALLVPAAVPPAALALALSAGAGFYDLPSSAGANIANVFVAAALGPDSVADTTRLIHFAQTQPLAIGALQFVTGAARFFLYTTLEAGLAAQLYLGLRDARAPTR